MSSLTPRSPEDILLVDDSPVNLRLLSEILTERGYHVRAVTSGPRALASIEMNPPDMVLLDVRMPEMDGYEVCARLRAGGRTGDIPILFISALDAIDDKVKAFAAGGRDYITKPFQVEEVLARVETHLALRRLQRNLQDANRRMQGELDLAAKVQASFIPKDTVDIPGWQLAAALIPAKTTSGDFYDVLPLADGRLGILVADVVDKGVGAALCMAMSCAMLRIYVVEHAESPARVFHEMNAHLLTYATADQFVTLFLGVLDPRTGVLVYGNAGHNPPFLIAADEAQPVRLLTRTGLPVGAMRDAVWEQAAVSIDPGSMLVLYTDGITEAESPEEGFFGADRLAEVAGRSRGKPAPAVRDAILARVREFSHGEPPADDIALMVLTCRAP